MDSTIEWLGTAAAAELLGVQSRTLYRFIDEGRLPAYRFGRVIRVMRVDLDAFIVSCRIAPGTLGDGAVPPEGVAQCDGSVRRAAADDATITTSMASVRA